MYWIELLRGAPSGFGFESDRQPLCIAERSAHPLGEAWSKMPRELRVRFPMMGKVGVSAVAESGNECLLLSPSEVLEVYAEFSRLLSLCRFESFEHGIDSRAFFERWRDDSLEDQFRTDIESIAKFLEEAVEAEAWMHISH